MSNQAEIERGNNDGAKLKVSARETREMTRKAENLVLAATLGLWPAHGNALFRVFGVFGGKPHLQ
jgi:hypothetical protein